jgi:hypothetical protein
MQRLLVFTRHVVLEEVRSVEEEVNVDYGAIFVEKHGRLVRVTVHHMLGMRKSMSLVSQQVIEVPVREDQLQGVQQGIDFWTVVESCEDFVKEVRSQHEVAKFLNVLRRSLGLAADRRVCIRFRGRSA